MKKIITSNPQFYSIFLLKFLLFTFPFVCHAQSSKNDLLKADFEKNGVQYRVLEYDEDPILLEIFDYESNRPKEDISIPNEMMIDGYSPRNHCDRRAVIEKIGDLAFFAVNINHLSIPSSLKRIGNLAFQGCNIKSIEFSEGLMSIGEYAFKSNSFEKVTLPESLLYMELGAFANCSVLQEISLPSTLIALGGFTFRYCGMLNDIYCYAKIPPIANDTDFGVIYNNDRWIADKAPGPDLDECRLYVPAESVELYKSAPGWKLMKNIIPIDSKPENSVTYPINEDTDIIYQIENHVITIPCNAHDTVRVYDTYGHCIDSNYFNSKGDFQYKGAGIFIISLNDKSIKVLL